MMETVKVELLTKHEHGGRVMNRGDVLELDPETANWLIGRGIAKKSMPPVRETRREKG